MTLGRSVMAGNDKLAARVKATESLARLYAAADECTRLYRRAGLPVPREVALLTTWGDDEARREEQSEKRQLVTIPPTVPAMERGWLSIDISNALPITVVPALLRDSAELPMGDIADRLQALGVAFSEGSLENIGTKLDHAKIIRRSMAGWQLLDPNRAPILSSGRLHGPKDIFQLQEVAAHRREAELLYFREYGTLSRSQLIDLLQQSDWVVAPVNEFLVKADLLALKSQKEIRRVKSDNPRNFDWELVKKKGQLRLANLNSA